MVVPPFASHHDFLQIEAVLPGLFQGLKRLDESGFVRTGDQLTVSDISNVVGAFVQVRCDVGGKQDASLPAFDQLLKKLQQVLPGHRVKSAGRLVKDQELG